MNDGKQGGPDQGGPGSRPDARTDSILDAASTVFAEHGFAGARVEAIARAAGINKAMLYYRLGDKARLYELVILSHFDRVAAALSRAAGDMAPGPRARDGVSASPGPSAQAVTPCGAQAGGDPLSAMLSALAGLFRQDPRLPRIMAWEFASGGRTLPDAVAGRWAGILARVAPLAARAGRDPALLWLGLLGPMVLTCLTEPLRARLAGTLPEPLRALAGFTVDDMARFLAGVYGNTPEDSHGR